MNRMVSILKRQQTVLVVCWQIKTSRNQEQNHNKQNRENFSVSLFVFGKDISRISLSDTCRDNSRPTAQTQKWVGGVFGCSLGRERKRCTTRTAEQRASFPPRLFSGWLIAWLLFFLFGVVHPHTRLCHVHMYCMSRVCRATRYVCTWSSCLDSQGNPQLQNVLVDRNRDH